MSFTFAFDVPGFNFSQAPQGAQLCGYDTGSGGIAWTPEMWAAHPGAVHIDQDPMAVMVTSDVLDVENGAVPVGSPRIAQWVKNAQSSFAQCTRPGQRRPVIYQSASNVTANVNALIAGGVTSGCGLWIARWDGNTAADIAALAAASGPFPVAGFQFADDGPYDANVFSTAWLDDVSGNQPDTYWSFGPLRNFQLTGAGPHSLAVQFDAPAYYIGNPPSPLPGVTQYEMAVSQGTYLGACISSYPRFRNKTGNPEKWQAGGLTPATAYTVGVRAFGDHSSGWSTQTFTTPAG
jgi:hypothetical protein